MSSPVSYLLYKLFHVSFFDWQTNWLIDWLVDVRLPNTRSKMYADQVACCPLVSNVEYAARALLRLEKDAARPRKTRDRQTPDQNKRGQRNNANKYRAQTSRRCSLWGRRRGRRARQPSSRPEPTASAEIERCSWVAAFDYRRLLLDLQPNNATNLQVAKCKHDLMIFYRSMKTCF